MMAIDYDGMSLSDQVFARLNLRVSGSTEKPKRKQQGRGENQLERDFAAWLEWGQRAVRFTWWQKPFVLRIGPDMTFEPDFMVDDGGNRLWIIDTKGPHSWEDSRIKIKIAAEKYPMWRWLIVTRPESVWRAREVTAAKGIGRRYIDLAWLS